MRQDEADRGEAPEKPTSAQLVELSRLKTEDSELRRTNEILRLASSFFRPGGRPDPAAAVAFVQAHREEFGVAPLCRMCGMPVSTFYDRVGRLRVTDLERGGVVPVEAGLGVS